MSNKLRKEVQLTDEEIVAAFGNCCTIDEIRYTRGKISDFDAYRGYCSKAGEVALRASNTLIVAGMQFWPAAPVGRLIVVDFGSVRGVLDPQRHVASQTRQTRSALELVVLAVIFFAIWAAGTISVHRADVAETVFFGLNERFRFYGADNAFQWFVSGLVGAAPVILLLSFYDALVKPWGSPWNPLLPDDC